MAKLDLRETLAETFEEVREDFGAEAARSRHQGEYRRQLAGKLNKDLRAKLGRPLPADAQAAKALFVQLAAAGMELKNKGISTGSMPLARLSEWLGTYGVSSADAAALVVPGQHLTLNPVSSENDAPKVASFDPELLTMQSKARPKRLKVRGSDGKEYWWLAKGGEDLRQVRPSTAVRLELAWPGAPCACLALPCLACIPLCLCF